MNRRKLTLALVGAVILPLSLSQVKEAHANTCIWQGLHGSPVGNWGDGSNWISSLVPSGTGVDVVTINSTSNSTYTFVNINCTINSFTYDVPISSGTIDGSSTKVLEITNGGTFGLGSNYSSIGLFTVASLTLRFSGSLTNYVNVPLSGQKIELLFSDFNGPGNVIKSGAGTFQIDGSSSFTGNLAISGGNVSIKASGGLGSGILEIGGGSLTFLSAMTLSHTITLDSGVSNVLDTKTNAVSVTSIITGDAFSKAGTGTLTLSNTNNSYSGGTTISAGVLKLGAASVAGTDGVIVSSGASLDLNGFTVPSHTLTISGTGAAGLGALTNSSTSPARSP